jgi:hypothetical protein
VYVGALLTLRPAARAETDHTFAQRGRIVVAGDTVEIRLPGRRRRRVTGVAEVVHVKRTDDGLGAAQLRASDGSVLAEFDVATWTNALRAGARFVRPTDPPISPLTYVPRLVAERLDVPLRSEADATPTPADRVVDSVSRLAGWSYIAPLAAAPIGLALLLVALIPRALGLEAVTQLVRLVAAMLVLAVIVVSTIAWRRVTGSDWRWRADDVLEPRPSRTVPRSFRRAARLVRIRGQFALAVAPGQEQWFGPPGEPMGLHRVALSGAGRPQSIDLLAADGVVLARLPFDYWAGGEGGQDALRSFCERACVEFNPALRPISVAPPSTPWTRDVHAVRFWPLSILAGSVPAVLIVATTLGDADWWPVTVWTARAAVAIALLVVLVAVGSWLSAHRPGADEAP